MPHGCLARHDGFNSLFVGMSFAITITSAFIMARSSFNSLFVGMSFAIFVWLVLYDAEPRFNSLFVGMSFAILFPTFYNVSPFRFNSLFVGMSFAMMRGDEVLENKYGFQFPFRRDELCNASTATAYIWKS